MRNFTKYIDQLCYEAFISLIGMIGALCGILISWISFIWSIGCFIRLEIREGFLALLVCTLSVIFWRGTGKLYEKLEITNVI